jgi:hypothetical protein
MEGIKMTEKEILAILVIIATYAYLIVVGIYISRGTWPWSRITEE